jgi:multidrug efflux pump subunit AcrB
MNMNKHLSPVNVTVSGSDGMAVRTVAAVVGDAISGSGFANVSVSSLNTEPESYLPSGGTMLDTLRRERPHLFEAPVQVQYLYNEEQIRDDNIAEPFATSLAGNGLSLAQEEEQERDLEAVLQEQPDPQADNPPLDSPADLQMAADIERERSEA